MKQSDWRVPPDWRRFRCIDAHTAGEPLRVITSDLGEIPGDDMLAKRAYLREHMDELRRILMWEPRGHADMYGCILTQAVSSDGDIGVLFLHNEGFSTMCGHGIIGLVKVGLDCGLLENVDPQNIRIDTPAGRVCARAELISGQVARVEFDNVPSFCLARGEAVEIPGLGRLQYDLAFGGAYYAFVSASACGLQLLPAYSAEIIAKGMAIKRAIQGKGEILHPFPGADLGYLYGVIFTGPAAMDAHSRQVCIFADGELDRSPTGTGVSARAAILHGRKELALGKSIVIESILGTSFQVAIARSEERRGIDCIVPRVAGRAYVTGLQEFLVDPQDPLGGGFFLGR